MHDLDPLSHNWHEKFYIQMWKHIWQIQRYILMWEILYPNTKIVTFDLPGTVFTGRTHAWVSSTVSWQKTMPRKWELPWLKEGHWDVRVLAVVCLPVADDCIGIIMPASCWSLHYFVLIVGCCIIILIPASCNTSTHFWQYHQVSSVSWVDVW